MADHPITAVVVGAGNRGLKYASYAELRPDRLKIVGVAEPSASRRRAAGKRFGVPPAWQFSSAEELVAQPKMADAAINGTMDRFHVPTSIPLLEAGYDILLEKPFAIDEDEMWRLLAARRRSDRRLMVCHVLRYAPFYRAIKEKVAEGVIGDIINIQTNEHVSYHHMAVAFVRGKWRNKAESGSSMLMSKCCHDLDLIMWFKSGISPVSVASFGSNLQFRPEKAPAGAGTRCLVDCPIEPDCLYSARKHYLDNPDRWKPYVWTALEDIPDPTPEQRLEQLKQDDRYGRCVWRSDNDVVDHQSLILDFEDGSTATHNMIGGTARPVRSIHLFGTTGEIQGVFEDSRFVIRRIDPQPGHDHVEEVVSVDVQGDMEGGYDAHGGGDLRLVEDFVSFLQGDPPSISCTTLEDSISAYIAGFAADRAMEERRVVDLAVP